MALTFTRHIPPRDNEEPMWKVSDGFTGMTLTQSQVRDLVSEVVLAGILTDEDLQTLRTAVPHSPDCRCEACTEHGPTDYVRTLNRGKWRG